MIFHSLNWKEFHNEIFMLYKTIAASETSYDLIIAISRGGLTVAHILSDFLQLPVTSVTCTSYHAIGKQGELVISYIPEGELEGKRILLVDDLSDTGATFRAITERLADKHPTSIDSCAIYTKPHTSFSPTYSNKEIDAWVVFPYEVRETIENVTEQLRKSGASEEEITSLLSSFSFPAQQYKEFID